MTGPQRRRQIATGNPRVDARTLQRAGIAAAGAIAFAFGWAGAGAIESILAARFPAPGMEVAGLERLSPASLLERVQLGAETGTPPEPAALRERLLEDPWVSDVRISRAIPGRLLVRLVERKPAALLISGDDAWLVDESGLALERAVSEIRPELPRLTMTRAFDPGARDPAVASALGNLELLDRAGLAVTEWRLDGNPAEAFPRARLRGVEPWVVFGRGDRVDQLQRLALVTALSEFREAEVVDLRFAAQVVLVPRAREAATGEIRTEVGAKVGLLRSEAIAKRLSSH